MSSESMQNALISYENAYKDFHTRIEKLETIKNNLQKQFKPIELRESRDYKPIKVTKKFKLFTDVKAINENFRGIEDEIINDKKVICNHTDVLENQYDLFKMIVNEFMAGLVAAFQTMEEVNAKASNSLKIGLEHQEELKRVIDNHGKTITEQEQTIRILKSFEEKISKLNVDQLIKRIEELRNDFTSIQEDVNQLTQKQEDLTDKFQDSYENLTDDFSEIKEKVEDNQEDISNIQNDLEEVEKIVYTCEERIATLEAKVQKMIKVLFIFGTVTLLHFILSLLGIF